LDTLRQWFPSRETDVDHQAKLAWAQKHTEALHDEMREHFASNAFTANLVIARELPADWPLIVGDILHNIRSALDNLAFALVEVARIPRVSDPARGLFPICASHREFKDIRERDMGGMAPEAQAIIESLQPYRREDSLHFSRLYLLNELANVDRHRCLVLAYPIPEPGLAVHAGVVAGNGAQAVGVTAYADGTESARRAFVGDPANPAEHSDSPTFPDVCFADSAVPFRGSVIRFLEATCDHIKADVFAPLDNYV
jgi:hypothetical protein